MCGEGCSSGKDGRSRGVAVEGRDTDGDVVLSEASRLSVISDEDCRRGRVLGAREVVDVNRRDRGRVSVGRNAGLALSARLARAVDAAALEALVNAEDDVIRNEGLEVEDLLDTESAEGGADDVRGKTEEALGDLLDTRVLAVEA